MMRRLALALIASCLVAPAFAQDAAPAAATANPAAATPPQFTAGLLGKPEILLPKGDVTGAVFLFSDKGGWSANEETLAATLQKSGAIVVGVDTPKFFAGLEVDKEDECVYLVSDIEDLSHQIQRALGTPNYHSPIIAGVGIAGTLGLAIAAQTPDATIGHTVAIDPAKAIPLVKPLCTDAPRTVENGESVYGLATGDLTNPVDVLYTSAAPADGRAHVVELQNQGFKIKSKDASVGAFAALEARLERILAPKSTSDDPLADLPLVELEATPKYSTMAVIYSGDGGWRDIDKSIGEALQKQGVPVVGVDSLRYFWSKKEPAQTAADLKRIIDTYTEKWGIDHVVLIGYSFGADILPSAYNNLAVEEKDQVAEISLLGLSPDVDYEISVGEFLGTNSSDGQTLPDLKLIKPSLIQCIYGEEEDDTVCPKLDGTGAELIKTTGGHHFDGDYDALAAKILDGLKRRVADGSNPQAQK
ncbi:alpha/beta hydrolase [Kaistia dalseonensis]|uniref:Type IV secretory pathway VirJ component n=1 Tax=Kaistia dalseonensis TaxID=410840 RepID=A0ABU0H8T3_9HYPH|nr:AcvB/VirJ family lysyl-phosphatidylglycerol hydrolase [Kaistia dalseonensis]MCX5495290.1 alpha/beta hydrolase [Kaistia dalseonensis]MDQ0437876.1 type IV secretory pathway VirJ component [Kaistia dalseonensis]